MKEISECNFLLNSRQDATTNKLAANCNLHLKEIKGRYVPNVRRSVIYKRRVTLSICE